MSLGRALMVSPQPRFITGNAGMVSWADVRIVQHWNMGCFQLGPALPQPSAFRTSQRKTSYVVLFSKKKTKPQI